MNKTTYKAYRKRAKREQIAKNKQDQEQAKKFEYTISMKTTPEQAEVGVFDLVFNTQPKGIKRDEGKPRTDLLSSKALMGTAQVLTVGAKDLSPHNWRKGIEWSRLVAAAQRHLLKFNDGIDLDEDTGLPHIDHLAACVMFLQELFRTHKHLDDRWHPGKIEEVVK